MSLKKKFTGASSFLKIISAVLFIILPFAGFYFGIKFQENINILAVPGNISNNGWRMYMNSRDKISIQYPTDFKLMEVSCPGQFWYKIGFADNSKDNFSVTNIPADFEDQIKDKKVDVKKITTKTGETFERFILQSEENENIYVVATNEKKKDKDRHIFTTVSFPKDDSLKLAMYDQILSSLYLW